MVSILKKIKKIKFKKNQKGITLVIAIMTMTLLLSISLSISNIVLRQIRITNTSNNSKPAFFTADSAIECAFYFDTLNIASSTNPTSNINDDFNTAVFGNNPSANTTTYLKCGLSSVTNVVKDVSNPIRTITNFDVDYGTMCAKVTVEKSDVNTKIVSRGYNTTMTPAGCDLSDLSSRRIVERGLTITY